MKSIWKWLYVCLLILGVFTTSVRDLGILILVVLVLTSNGLITQLNRIEGKLDAIQRT